MFCPYCGREFEKRDSKYCPFCGQDLTKDSTLVERVRYSNLWMMRWSFILGLAAVILLTMTAFYIMDSESGTAGPDDGEIDHVPKDVVIDIDGRSSIVLGDDFAKGRLKAYLNDAKQLYVCIDESISQGYSHYRWVLRDEVSNTYLTKEKEDPEMVWPSPKVGRFTIMAYCYKEGGGLFDVLSGSVVYQGEKLQHYVWSFDGRSYSATSPVLLEDQVKYRSPGIVPDDVRSGKVRSSAGLFVVTDGSVALLHSKLLENYGKWYGTPAPGGYLYASFVLSFIQSMGYAPDSMNHYQKDYWAFPAETLFNGCGDDEDLAFLYVSLMKCAGYRCGLFDTPEEMMAAVSVDDVPDMPPIAGHHSAAITHRGTGYMVCEPSSDCNAPLGMVRDCYGFDSSGKFFKYYDEPRPGDYGLIPC